MKLACLVLLIPGSLWAQFAPAPRAAYVFSGGTWAPLAGAGAQTGVTAPQPIGLYVRSGGNWVAWDGSGGGGGGATIPSTTNLISGSGTGNGADSGIVPANVMLLNGAQTSTGTKTFGATNFAGNIAIVGAFGITRNTGLVTVYGTNATGFGATETMTTITNTSGNSTIHSIGNGANAFTPASGTGNFAGLLIDPVINGTSSGSAYGLLVAPVTNTLTGGTVKLASFGTATGALFSGYAEKAYVSLAGAIAGSAFLTTTNCSSAASPAVCAAAASGSVAIPSGVTQAVVVNTTAVTANSQIQLTEDRSLGTRLGVTCDTTAVPGLTIVTARTAGTSFTIGSSITSTNPVCVSYTIVN